MIENTQEAATDKLKQFKEVYEDKVAEVNGREYTFSNTSHAKRLQIFSFFTTIEGYSDLRWLATKEWDAIRKIIDTIVMYNGSALSRLPEHWEKYEEDYLMLYIAAMGALSYPFLKGSLQGLESQNQLESQK